MFKKYKLLEQEQKDNLVLVPAYLLLLISAFLPYKNEITRDKIDQASQFLDYGEFSCNETVFYGYESGFFFYFLFLAFMINAAGFTGQSIANKICLILLSVLYFISQFFTVNWGAVPFSDSFFAGFHLILVGVAIIVFQSFRVVFRKDDEL